MKYFPDFENVSTEILTEIFGRNSDRNPIVLFLDFFEKFSESGNISHFSLFDMDFYRFSKFLMFWKEEMPLVNSNSICIYEMSL